MLFRTSHHSAALEIELTRRHIPFVKFGGLKFLDTAHVKDLLALLRFIENPRDRVAGFRVMQLLPGVGPASAHRVLAGCPSRRSARIAVRYPPPPRSGDGWDAFVRTLQTIGSGNAGWPAEIGHARCWYAPHLERMHDDAAFARPTCCGSRKLPPDIRRGLAS